MLAELQQLVLALRDPQAPALGLAGLLGRGEGARHRVHGHSLGGGDGLSEAAGATVLELIDDQIGVVDADEQPTGRWDAASGGEQVGVSVHCDGERPVDPGELHVYALGADRDAHCSVQQRGSTEIDLLDGSLGGRVVQRQAHPIVGLVPRVAEQHLEPAGPGPALRRRDHEGHSLSAGQPGDLDVGGALVGRAGQPQSLVDPLVAQRVGQACAVDGPQSVAGRAVGVEGVVGTLAAGVARVPRHLGHHGGGAPRARRPVAAAPAFPAPGHGPRGSRGDGRRAGRGVVQHGVGHATGASAAVGASAAGAASAPRAAAAPGAGDRAPLAAGSSQASVRSVAATANRDVHVT